MKLHRTKEDVATAAILEAVKTVRDDSTVALSDAECLERLGIGYDAHLRAEVDRLNQCLTYEQHRAGRQGTHWEGCHTGGPEHYECALRRIAEFEAVLDEIEATEPVIGGVND